MTPNGKRDDVFQVLLYSRCDLHFLQTLQSKTLHTRSIKEKDTNERLKTIEHCQLREASLMYILIDTVWKQRCEWLINFEAVLPTDE